MTTATFLALLAGAVTGPLVPTAQVVRAYAGVTCRVPNSIACDRIGIAVDVRPRPLRAAAFFGVRRVALARHGGASYWSGQLRDAGIDRMLLADVPLIQARVVATFRDGHRETLPVLTPLRLGWG
ncbi:hypothetical protein [Conexibacter woesei]|uniref:Uncharacterized protein n=1 Tax=Conexibacter woesei (strain DSM 14684 / CCUG 47730 / CIP 108061 / JCM 11494 / NBRC 100937 / ID131577) TaxID=469383 RepID=D3FAC8_CONWI|nr:hypothetical protein [Conexibacter woesei]ADB49197.1 hypothetical protein Cwoe_0764 [Conexibacter woesei DSM 14684]